MQVTFNRKAHRLIADAGGSLILEARSTSRCWCGAHLEASVGAPADAGAYLATETDGIRIFARGVMVGPGGEEQSANSLVPHHIRVRLHRGRLSAQIG